MLEHMADEGRLRPFSASSFEARYGFNVVEIVPFRESETVARRRKGDSLLHSFFFCDSP